MRLQLNRPAKAPEGAETRGFSHKNHFEDLAEILPNAETIFDVGAHEGHVAEQFWQNFPTATIYAFEPAPRTFATLRARAGKVPRLVLENQAISDKSGRVEFFEYADPAANSLFTADDRAHSQIPTGIGTPTTIQVDVTTLDSYCATHAIATIDLIKFDIQGGELRALEGAVDLLVSGRVRAIFAEVLFIPVYVGQAEFHQLQVFLSRYGFQLFDFYNFSYGENGQLRWGDALFLHAALSG